MLYEHYDDYKWFYHFWTSHVSTRDAEYSEIHLADVLEESTVYETSIHHNTPETIESLYLKRRRPKTVRLAVKVKTMHFCDFQRIIFVRFMRKGKSRSLIHKHIIWLSGFDFD